MKRSMHRIFKAKLQQVLLILLCFAVLPLSKDCETSVLGNDAYQKIPEDLEVTLSTDKTEYQFGDDIKMMLIQPYHIAKLRKNTLPVEFVFNQ